ncbi:outer membrane protein [Bradyrhizobium commune]|uniref:Outer membrane protein beta-barrel domain-containing protein n=1 Tax=Bradyrhizobium commune TaxID=83627 RepID=A0A7S9D4M1_9BRAD|nr:hypothetical protein [Bradyrhizobium commune]QPF91071.1 hypothetical protein IC761_32180 [Bradyrhizobium commune]
MGRSVKCDTSSMLVSLSLEGVMLKFRTMLLACFATLALSSAAHAVVNDTDVTAKKPDTEQSSTTITLTGKTSTGEPTHHSYKLHLDKHHATARKHIPADNKTDVRKTTAYFDVLVETIGKPPYTTQVPSEVVQNGGTITLPDGTTLQFQPTGGSMVGGMTPITPVPYTWSGFYIGMNGSGAFSNPMIRERITGTMTTTSRLNDSDVLGGIGVQGGYDFGGFGLPGATFGPFASFNYLGQSVDHGFPGGSFIGTHYNWTADLGVKAGYWVTPRAQLYALGGVEFLNYDLESNFTGPVLRESHTATGALVGIGAELTRPDWHMGNGQWTAYGQATYSWFCGDTFRAPLFSPGFDYNVRSNQMRIAVGFNYRPGAAPPPP